MIVLVCVKLTPLLFCNTGLAMVSVVLICLKIMHALETVFLLESLELHQFAYISVDEENTISMYYLEAENVSTVWPGMYNSHN